MVEILLPLGIQTRKVIVAPAVTATLFSVTDECARRRAVEVHGQRLIAGIVLRG